MPKPAFHCFTIDPTTYTYRCSGCGKVDRSVWDKVGVDHYSDPGVVCGAWALEGATFTDYDGHKKRVP